MHNQAFVYKIYFLMRYILIIKGKKKKDKQMHWLSPNTVSSKFSLLNDKPKFSALEGNCLIYIFSEGCEANSINNKKQQKAEKRKYLLLQIIQINV